MYLFSIVSTVLTTQACGSGCVQPKERGSDMQASSGVTSHSVLDSITSLFLSLYQFAAWAISSPTTASTYSSATGPSSESAHEAKQLSYMRVIRARQAANQSKYPSKSYLKRHRRHIPPCTQSIWGKVLCKYSTWTVRNLSTTCKCSRYMAE